MQHLWAGMLGACLVLGGAGCEEKPKAPAQLSISNGTQPVTEPAATTRPSEPQAAVQEFLNGARQRVELGTFPFTLEVPKNWKLRSTDGTPPLITLEGPAPEGDVYIQLSSPPPAQASLSAEAISAMDSAARKEIREHPEKAFLCELRPLNGGPAKVIEKRSLHHLPAVPPGPGSPGGAPAGDMVDWTLMAFAPHDHDKNFGVHVLSFIGLTKEQYDKDKEFLQKILETLKYDPTVGG